MSQFCFFLMFALLGLANICFAADTNDSSKPADTQKNPVVLIKTNMGDIKVELFADKAPNTVKNFIDYVNEGQYNGTIFHRVIPGFMVQGGGFDKDMKQKATRAPIKNEGDNGLQNKKGTLAMARKGDPHSASAQFFINTVDNSFLNFRSTKPSEYGYAVFGKVISGMDVVEKIEKSKTTNKGPFENVPATPVEIIEAKVV